MVNCSGLRQVVRAADLVFLRTLGAPYWEMVIGKGVGHVGPRLPRQIRRRAALFSEACAVFASRGASFFRLTALLALVMCAALVPVSASAQGSAMVNGQPRIVALVFEGGAAIPTDQMRRGLSRRLQHPVVGLESSDASASTDILTVSVSVDQLSAFAMCQGPYGVRAMTRLARPEATQGAVWLLDAVERFWEAECGNSGLWAGVFEVLDPFSGVPAARLAGRDFTALHLAEEVIDPWRQKPEVRAASSNVADAACVPATDTSEVSASGTAEPSRDRASRSRPSEGRAVENGRSLPAPPRS